MRKPMKKHWYYQTIRECYTCMRQEISRERRYGRKPKDPFKRYDWRRFQCQFCYWG